MNKIFFAIAMLFSQSIFAALLTVTPGDKTIEGVTLGKSAVLNVDNYQGTLDSLGAGVREKKVAIVKVKVYVGQAYGHSQIFVRTNEGALDSVNAMESVAFQMTFLRDVDGVQLQTAFADGFAANKVDVKKPEIKKFLDAVAAGGQALKGKTITVVGVKIGNEHEGIIYENANGGEVSIGGPSGFVKNVMSLWFGVFADKEGQALKDQILGGN